MIIKLNWSGGKDSTAAAMLHLHAAHELKMVYYIPYLENGIPLIMPEHYGFMIKTAEQFYRAGAELYEAKGITYKEHTEHVITRGKNKGKHMCCGLGFGFCQFRDRSKVKALESINVGTFDFCDIGIAADETRRKGQLIGNKISILCERGYTEKDALAMCVTHGVLSPIYNKSTRYGCAICPNAEKRRLCEYIKAYPQAKKILLMIEEKCRSERPECYPYRGGKWWSDRMAEGGIL